MLVIGAIIVFRCSLQRESTYLHLVLVHVIKLQHAIGLIINNNLLYVAEEYNHRVSIFTTDGQFVSCFGEKGNEKDQFNVPCDIALDNEGYFYICDFWNDRLVMY